MCRSEAPFLVYVCVCVLLQTVFRFLCFFLDKVETAPFFHQVMHMICLVSVKQGNSIDTSVHSVYKSSRLLQSCCCVVVYHMILF